MSSMDAARDILSQLARAGITDLVVCPGSRSAPLAYVASGLNLDIHVETDERVAGFLALGLGKVHRPAAVITTSGTAVANLHPAVLEAYHAGVPLVVLSADRPERLRGRGANQTTIQPGMFAPTIRAEIDVASDSVPDLAPILRQARLGPVHINIAFDDPLYPDAPQTHTVETGQWGEIEQAGEPIELDDRPTIIVAGASAPAHVSAGRMAGEGVPIIAEPSARELGLSSVVPAGNAVLPAFSDRIERVIVTGHPTLTRPISSLLSRTDIEVIAVDEPPVATNLSGEATVVPVMPRLTQDPSWLEAWQEAGRASWERGADYLSGTSLDSMVVGKVLATDPGAWMLGASSIIRDVFTFSITNPAPRFANRGLAGIDGTVSTARGIATTGPLRVAVGDLTFLHDLGSLVPTVGEEIPDLDILVIDDGGGGIFTSLEHGAPERSSVFERMFRTEKALDVRAVGRALGWETIDVTSCDELESVFSQPPAHRLIRVGCRVSTDVARKKRDGLRVAMAVQ